MDHNTPLIIPSESKLELAGTFVSCRSDGYFNLTELCSAGGKLFADWKRNKRAHEFLKVLETFLETPIESLLVYISGPNNIRSTWGHPYIAINIAQWISPEFEVRVSIWVNERMILLNSNELHSALNNISIETARHSNRHEAEIRDALVSVLNGEKEVKCPCGIVDVVTDDEIIEIKSGCKWKHALGQVLAYAEYFHSKSARIHLFDCDDIELDIVRKVCNKHNVRVTIAE